MFTIAPILSSSNSRPFYEPVEKQFVSRNAFSKQSNACACCVHFNADMTHGDMEH